MYEVDKIYNYAIAKYSGQIPVKDKEGFDIPVEGSLLWQQFLRNGQDDFDCYVRYFETREDAEFALRQEKYKPVCYKEPTFGGGEIWKITEYVVQDYKGHLLDFWNWEINTDTGQLEIY